MIRKGFISSLSSGYARVTFPDMDNCVTPDIPVCMHIGDLLVNDMVLVAFWGAGMGDGAVIGKVG